MILKIRFSSNDHLNIPLPNNRVLGLSLTVTQCPSDDDEDDDVASDVIMTGLT